MKKAKMKLYYVQAFQRAGKRLLAEHWRDCGTERRALAMGLALSEHYDGVLVFSVEGQPEFDFWDEPHIMERHGSVPSDVGVG